MVDNRDDNSSSRRRPTTNEFVPVALLILALIALGISAIGPADRLT